MSFSSIVLPHLVKYNEFCEPRIREIQALDKHLGACEHGQRAFQKLPRNMQRRNVSYNPQRLPYYLREKHRREVGNNIKIHKRPSRKYRRRPSNLLAEYNRRQKSEVWLETHIWHAKRFHMVKRWGYVLPKTPTFKSYRASIRAASESCLVQDVSYECCLEIEGPISEIIKPFINILPHSDFNVMKKEIFADGKISLDTFIYKKNKYPFGAIGRATMICSCLPSQKSIHKLWIWVHPSIFETVLNILIELFDFKIIEDEKLSEKDYLSPSESVVDDVLSCRNTHFKKTPKYLSNLNKLTILKDTLVKFRFTGPESYLLLKSILIPSNIQSAATVSDERSCKNNSENTSQEKLDSIHKTLDNPQETSNSRERIDNSQNEPWWVSFYSNPDFVKNHKSQLSIWNSFKDTDSKSRKVISLVIRDVRAVLPYKKKPLNDIVPSDKDETCIENCENYITPLHPIFDADIRMNVTQKIKSNHEINKEREKRLVPGGPLPLVDDESRIPVLLMQRSASHISNLGSGWDIVLPSGWGRQMLVALSMNGAVIGGQDEEESLMVEFLTPPPSHHLPDTAVGAVYGLKEREEKENEYFKKPPNCRPNYLVFGIKFPFRVDWMELVRHWDNSCNEFFVVRNIDYLRYLSLKSCKKINKINEKLNGQSLKRKNYKDEEQQHSVKKLIAENGSVSSKSSENYSFSMLMKDLKNSLLYVRIILLGKGSLEPFATICLPTKNDLEENIDDLNCTNITEPSHEDEKAMQRSTLKLEHKKHLSSIRRKRKKARSDVLCKEADPSEKHSTMQEAVNAAVKVVDEENADILKKIEGYKNEYNNLWLYDPDKTFQSNSRKIIGFLCQGRFCLRLGRSGGLGCVVTEPLLEFMAKCNLESTDDFGKSNQIQVLIRNPSNLQYRWARLVILNVC